MLKRRHLVIGMASLPLASFLAAGLSPAFSQTDTPTLDGDTLTTADGDVIIHPVDHASLLLGWQDQVIYVDPVGGAELYQGLPAPTAILITHAHGDHFDIPTLEAIAGTVPILTTQEVFDKLPEALKANATAVANGEEGALNALPVAAIPAHNTTPDRMNYHPVGVGNGYLVKFADKIVYIAGDTEPTPEMLALENIDIAFLPMNLPYTMTVDQAAEAVNTFKPRIVYPYHYAESDLEAFKAQVGEGVEVRLRNWYPNAG
ncbi:MBL fold metallo-hydrolase [uncultured Devosia sp.]|uniref:MBL fold metallo-hydrolase n=1 Tax=uncultured Devosia sp. TaxID=211434 RepID=UPI0035CA0A7B